MSKVKEVKESDKDKPELVNDGSEVKDGEKDVEIEGEKGEEGKEEVEEVEEEVEEEAGDEVEEEVEDEVEERGEELEKLEEGEEDKHEKEKVPGSEGVEENGIKDIDVGNAVSKSNNLGLSEEVPALKACNSTQSDVPGSNVEKELVKDENEVVNPHTEDGDEAMLVSHDPPNKHQGVDNEAGAPNKGSCELNKKLIKEEELKNEASNKEDAMDAECRISQTTCIFDADTSGGGESGTEDEQAAFIFELDKFHKERFLEFKPPKFYGEPLNLLKLWRSVMKLGGYDKVTACKYWRQVGESFKPPKTCTTVSWTFRIFYEKALLEYEKHRTSGDGTYIPAGLPMSTSVENQASGSGRARRDAAARAMQGWHSQRILDNGEVSDPIIKDKNSTSFNKREKQLKNLNQSILKQRKRPLSVEATANDVRAKIPKSQSETTVIDIGSPADWVKINVRVTKDCYEVYALVPGLLREEVRVQSDPAGRLVISGEPENPDNPWNVTPFKKVVILPTRIDPHQTSAVVTLHGQLFVRVPFEQYE